MNYELHVYDADDKRVQIYPTNNNAYPISSVSWSIRREGGNWQLTFVIDKDGDSYGDIDHGYTVELYLDQTLRFSGFVSKINPKFSKTQVPVTVSGFVKRLEKCIVGASDGSDLEYEDSSIEDILTSIFSDITTKTPITYTADDVYAEFHPSQIIVNDEKASAVVKNLSKIQGNVVWGVDEDKAFYFDSYKPQLAVDNNTVILCNFDEGENEIAYDDVPQYVGNFDNEVSQGLIETASNYISCPVSTSWDKNTSNGDRHGTLTIEGWCFPTANTDVEEIKQPTIAAINTHFTDLIWNKEDEGEPTAVYMDGYLPIASLKLNGEYVQAVIAKQWKSATYGGAQLRNIMAGNTRFSRSVVQPTGADAMVPLNTWTHVGLRVSNASPGYATLFVNGTAVTTESLGYDGAFEPTELSNGSGLDFYPSIGAAVEFDYSTTTPDLVYNGGFKGRLRDVRITDGSRDIAAEWAADNYDYPLRYDADTLGLWRLNEGTGTSCYNDGTVASTTGIFVTTSGQWVLGPSGGNNNGRVYSTDMWTAAGKFNRGIRFSNNANRKISFGTDPLFATVADAGSMEFWLKPDNLTQKHHLVNQVASNADWNFKSYIQSGTLVIERNGTSLDVISAGGELTAESWHYISLVFGNSGKMYIGVNGTAVASGAQTGTVTGTSLCDLLVGTDGFGGSQALYNMDNLRIRNATLPPADMSDYQTAVTAAEETNNFFAGRDVTYVDNPKSSLDIVNRLKVKGTAFTDENAFITTVNETDSQATHGIRESEGKNELISSEDTARRWAYGVFQKLAYPADSGTLKIACYKGSDYFEPTKLVRLYDFEDQSVNKTYEPEEVSYSIEDGSLSIEIKLGDSPRSLSAFYKWITSEVNVINKRINSQNSSISDQYESGSAARDITPPAKVAGEAVTPFIYIDQVSGREISTFKAAWTELSEPDVENYEIQLQYPLDAVDASPGWTEIAKVAFRETNYVHRGNLPADAAYELRIRGVDRSGNKGQWSDTVEFTSAKDETAPSTPTITITPCVHGNLIEVARPTDPDYDEILIAADTATGPTTLIHMGRETTFVHETHSGGTEWHYRARVKDYSSNLSEWSLSGTGTTLTLPIDHNLCINGGFLNFNTTGGLRHWDDCEAISRKVITDPLWGVACGKMTTSTATIGLTAYGNNFYAMEADYTFSVYLRKITGGNVAEVNIGFIDDEENEEEVSTVYVSNTDWQRFEFTSTLDWTPGVTKIYKPQICLVNYGLPDLELHIDCAMVQKGSKASPWIPNDRDSLATAIPFVYACDIADGEIDGDHIADGAIENNHIADDAVSGGQIIDGSISNDHILDALGAIDGLKVSGVLSNINGLNVGGLGIVSGGLTVGSTVVPALNQLNLDGNLQVSGGAAFGNTNTPGVGVVQVEDYVEAKGGIIVGTTGDPGDKVADFRGEVKGTRHTLGFNYVGPVSLAIGGTTYIWLKCGESAPSGYSGGLVVPRAGSVAGGSVYFNITAAGSSGSIYSQIYKNGSFIYALPSISGTATGHKTGSGTQARNTDSFAANDMLMCRLALQAGSVGTVTLQDVIMTIDCYYDA